MDSRLSWLDSVRQRTQELAPPPVSFGSSSNTDLPNGEQHRHVFTSASVDNISEKSIRSENTEDNDPESIPLSLTAQDLTLEESKTYMRWYLDILARTNQRTVSMSDVYQFLANFRLSTATKEQLNRVFSKILLLINIGEFFALLRVVSHTLNGEAPSRALIRVKAPVPVPPLILSKKRQNDEDDFVEPLPTPAVPLDLDLFTQFMLTGERPDEARKKRLKKLKSVTFSDEIVTDVHDVHEISPEADQPLDYLLPMNQLLTRLHLRHTTPNQPAAPSINVARVLSPDPEEKQILHDMEGEINHFQNLHCLDTMLVGGVPTNIHIHHGVATLLPRLQLPQPLQPNMTGPAQMAQYYNGNTTDYSGGYNELRPNTTGPADMSQNGVSLQLFTAQMTGDTAANTSSNARIGLDANDKYSSRVEEDVPGDAPPVPATRRVRLYSQPSPQHINWDIESNKLNGGTPPPDPSSNVNAAHLGVPPRFRSVLMSPPPPVPPRSPLATSRPVPPPPPPRRQVSSPPAVQSLDAVIEQPPPLPAKIPHAMYLHNDSSSSTSNILDDLKALQAEVDRIRAQTGGF